MTNKEKFLLLVSPEKCDTMEIIQWRIDNRAWLRLSQKAAIHILIYIDEHKIDKLKFSELSGIPEDELNLIVKGSENLSIGTITKIERVIQKDILR